MAQRHPSLQAIHALDGNPFLQREELQPVGAGGEARYCKKCMEVFYGGTCRQRHANFMYTRRVPAGVLAPPEPEPAPVRASVGAGRTSVSRSASAAAAAASAAAAPLPQMFARRVVDARNPAALAQLAAPAVTTRLTLSGSLAGVAGAANSIKRRTFEKHFAADVAAALSAAGPPVASDQIRILGVAPGSVIVTFEVQAGANGAPVSPSHISAAFASEVSLPQVGASTSGPPAFPSLADTKAWPALEKTPAAPPTHARAVARTAESDVSHPAATRSRHPSLVALARAHKARDNRWLKGDARTDDGTGESLGLEQLEDIWEGEDDGGAADVDDDPQLVQTPSGGTPEVESDDVLIARTFAAHRRLTMTAMDAARATIAHETAAATGTEREAKRAAEKHVAHCEAHDDHIDHELEQAHLEIAALSADMPKPDAPLTSPRRLFSPVDLRNDSETYRDRQKTPDWRVDSPSFSVQSVTPVSTEAGGSSDHLTVHVATWNLGNAAPPEHLNRWLPRRGAGADIVMVAIQEGTYSKSVAKESVCGTACGALLGAIGAWKNRLKSPLEAASCFALVSLISDGQAKQAKQMRDVLAGPLYDPTAWTETFHFDLYPSSRQLLVQIVEPGNFGSGGTRAECVILLEEGRVVDGPDQGCRLIADDDGTGKGCTYELDLLCPSRGDFLGHCEIQLSLDGGTASDADGNRSRMFTALPVEEATAQSKKQKADHLKHIISQQLGSPYVLRPDLQGWLGEMRLMVFIRAVHVQHIRGCEFKTQTTGLLGGRLPNKGGLVAKLLYKQTSLCFVCTHLQAHEGFSHCQGRNEMARRVQEGARVGDTQVDLGNQFDHVFWAGDLNYRVDLARFKGDTYLEASFEEKWDEVARMIACKSFGELQKYEELGKEIVLGNAFAGFTDAMLHDSETKGRYFAPTFKVVRHKRGEYIKKRVSSWCDRVLWASMDGSEACVNLEGISSDPALTTSDHKPVYARYRLAIPKSLGELHSERSAKNLTYEARPVSMVVVRIAKLRCQGISQKGCYSLSLDPNDIKKCKPVVVVKGVGELASLMPSKVVSKVAKRGSAHFKGTIVIPLQGASTPDDLLQFLESPVNPDEETIEHSPAITLTVLDATGHKHPIHGAVCGHSALALRAPAFEESIPLNKSTANEYNLKAPAGFAVDHSQNLIRRDFVSDFDFVPSCRECPVDVFKLIPNWCVYVGTPVAAIAD